MSINSHCRILSRNILRLSISKFLEEGRRKKWMRVLKSCRNSRRDPNQL
ncbi:MAG: hypothetical protein F6K48_29210 [Okeania sp. SIO3H1]|nr:hypothetical protein [Okeania sp. SIO1I7]NEN92755.1 hypothetical protein [Okeania sp. SIO3H1]NET26725.1 hypothetical protein [Okeania sp. SIO1I7]